MTDLLTIKAGDRVVVQIGPGRWKHQEIRTVHHVSRTLIFIDWTGRGYMQKFYRATGYQQAPGAFANTLLRLASNAECREWDSRQEAESIAENKKKTKAAKVEALKAELRQLFNRDSIMIEIESCGSSKDWEERQGKLWTVAFHQLTTEQVRALAAAAVPANAQDAAHAASPEAGHEPRR